MKRICAGVVAMVMAMVMIFSPKNIAKADENSKEKSSISVEFENEIGQKKISYEDAIVIKEAFGYGGDERNYSIWICSENTSAWVDWDNSTVLNYDLTGVEVLCPILSRDENDKLVVKKVVKNNPYYGDYEEIEYSYSLFSDSGTRKPSGKELRFTVDPNEDISLYLNSCMGTPNFYIPSYERGKVVPNAGEIVPVTDVYILRFTYLKFEEELKREINRYTDYWILPESVSTVLKLEDGNFSENSSVGKWIKDNIGWWYRNPDGSYPASKWLFIDGKWYFFDKNGYMKTGWILYENAWYYLNKDGDMAVDCKTPDGFIVDKNGVWIR